MKCKHANLVIGAKELGFCRYVQKSCDPQRINMCDSFLSKKFLKCPSPKKPGAVAPIWHLPIYASDWADVVIKIPQVFTYNIYKSRVQVLEWSNVVVCEGT